MKFILYKLFRLGRLVRDYNFFRCNWYFGGHLMISYFFWDFSDGQRLINIVCDEVNNETRIILRRYLNIISDGMRRSDSAMVCDRFRNKILLVMVNESLRWKKWLAITCDVISSTSPFHDFNGGFLCKHTWFIDRNGNRSLCTPILFALHDMRLVRTCALQRPQFILYFQNELNRNKGHTNLCMSALLIDVSNFSFRLILVNDHEIITIGVN